MHERCPDYTWSQITPVNNTVFGQRKSCGYMPCTKPLAVLASVTGSSNDPVSALQDKETRYD